MHITAEYETNLDANVHSLLDINLIVKILAKYNINEQDIISGSGISVQDLRSEAHLASFNQKLIIFSNVIKLSPDPAIGLISGSAARFSDFGFFGYAVISSATLGDAIELGFKYLKLVGPVFKKTVKVEGDNGVFTSEQPIDLGELLPFCTEYWFAAINALCSEIIGGPFISTKIKLPYPKPSYADKYTEMFNCDIEFNADAIEWHFDAKSLSLNVPSANPLTVKMCVNTCEDMMAVLSQPESIEDQIKAFILNSTGKFPNIEQTASHIGVSSRTLRRKLNSTNSNFQKIIDEVRLNLATKYLQSTKMTIDEIAIRIGFSEASNFRHAYKKWSGCTPNEMRVK